MVSEFIHNIDVTKEEIIFSKNTHTTAQEHASLALRLRFLLEQQEFVAHLKKCSGFATADQNVSYKFDRELAQTKDLLEKNYEHVIRSIYSSASNSLIGNTKLSQVETKSNNILFWKKDNASNSEIKSNSKDTPITVSYWADSAQKNASIKSLLNWQASELRRFREPEAAVLQGGVASQTENKLNETERLRFSVERSNYSNLAIQLALWTASLSSAIMLPTATN